MCVFFCHPYVQTPKQKIYLLPEILDQLSNLNMSLALVFALVLLKLDFYCCSNFVLS